MHSGTGLGRKAVSKLQHHFITNRTEYACIEFVPLVTDAVHSAGTVPIDLPVADFSGAGVIETQLNVTAWAALNSQILPSPLTRKLAESLRGFFSGMDTDAVGASAAKP